MGLPCAPSLPPFVPFLFSLLAVSCLSSKFLHIAQHLQSVPLLELILFSPTLFVLDVLVICLGRVLLRGPDGPLQLLACILGGCIAFVTYGAAAIQFGFFFETGSQVEWGASGSFLRDPTAMKILLSGMGSVAISGAVVFVISWFITPYPHAITGNALSSARNLVLDGIRTTKTLLPLAKSPAPRWNLRVLIPTVLIGLALIIIRAVRPEIPYDHLSSAIPFSLSEAFHRSRRHCHGHRPRFPFPDLISEEHWEYPHDDFPGWLPHRHWPSTWPEWLPEPPPSGFHRWKKEIEHHERVSPGGCHGPYQAYNAVTDPSKISNLDLAPHQSLREVFDRHGVEIEHVILLSLESARKEVFPMKEGTPLFDAILESHSQDDRDSVIDKLSVMTPTAQMVTGEYALNSSGVPNDFRDTPWLDSSGPDRGGINVQGAVTTSSLTLKSLLSSHCGVQPLPVDLLEESQLDIYQPCLPHIFKLFNEGKDASGWPDDAVPMEQRPWKSVFMQSSTDTYDRQHEMNKQIGFQETIVKATMDAPGAKHPPQSEEINYFGYADSELDPYVQDLISDAAEGKSRLFLSHMTVATHHPWKTPMNFGQLGYMGSHEGLMSKHQDLNSFLNTVAFIDEWVGQILKHLDEANIADKTLVVLVGDHGQAFFEDASAQGTFENPHISNFRVPLVFRHPGLPRIDVSANATSLSIIPTILDLLIQTRSLNGADRRVAEHLIHEYQGQSLIRPFRSEHHGRRPWNMGLINSGGSLLSVTTAGRPYRLVVPIQSGADRNHQNEKVFPYRFTHTDRDPAEKAALEAWTVQGLQQPVMEAYGAEAMNWVDDASRMAQWWVTEQKRIWNYDG